MNGISFETRRGRAPRTQAFFREINDRIAGLAPYRDVLPVHFICECLRIDCRSTIALSLADYEAVRADPARFIVLAGHEDLETEDVLEGSAGMAAAFGRSRR